MSKVFISYGSADLRSAESLCTFLEADGIPCWMAPRDIASGNYAGEITRALKAADAVIVVCSKASSRSEHVKNEVTLAFNNAKLILPYCLDENPFDDDLEYYLSSKQRITASGDPKKDFQLIERIVRDFRGQPAATPLPAASPAQPRPRKRPRLYIPAGLVVLAAILFLALHNNRPADKTPGPESKPDTVVTVQPLTTPSETKPQAVKKPVSDPDADTFTGTITGGVPDGFGTYTFKKRRRIDIHDPQERYAEAGDYIEGSWTRGHLNYGEWYGADGRKIDFIELGDQPDTDRDKQLGTCVKP